jgi:glutamate dehydrogenase/leucine dehydrogenase
MREKKHQHRIDLRSATYLIAIDKVASAYLERGIFP